MLMMALDGFLKNNVKELIKGNVCLMTIGRDKPLPDNILARIKKVSNLTKSNKGLKLCLALNYGSRQEIVDAIRKIVNLSLKQKLRPEEINENNFSDFLYTNNLPDPDLLIRTSGEQRISNFLLWQLSYAEFYFTKKHWPDFTKEEFKEAIMEYQNRERRFGAIKQ